MLRKLVETDIPAVLAIERAVQYAPWPESTFIHCFSPGYHSWVIEERKKILGFIITAIKVNDCHILNICVHPDYQRQGLGKQLMHKALTFAETREVKMVYLEVRKSNECAIKLYHALGFAEIGERKNYYPAAVGQEDAIIYALELGNLYL